MRSSVNIGKKIKAIRIEESISQTEFAQLIDISVSTVRAYEQNINIPDGKSLEKITNHPQLFKYTLWLMTGKTAPESGQICPAFSIQEQLGIIEPRTEKRA